MMRVAILPLLTGLAASVSALDTDLSFIQSPSLNEVPNGDFLLRNLAASESALIAEYHNNGLGEVMEGVNDESTYTSVIEAATTFVKSDERFDGFSADEVQAMIEGTLVLSGDGNVDAESTLVNALALAAPDSPVVSAMLDLTDMIKSEQIDSFDQMIEIVRSAAEASNSEEEQEMADIFADVVVASKAFWTDYAPGGDGRRDLQQLPRCRFWARFWITLADAAGAVLGFLAGLQAGGGWWSIFLSIIFAIVFSCITQQGFGCVWFPCPSADP